MSDDIKPVVPELPPPAPPPPTRSQTAIRALESAWYWFCQFARIPVVGAQIRKELGGAVKTCPVICTVLVIGCVYYFTKSRGLDAQVSTLTNDASFYKASISSNSATIGTYESHNRELNSKIQERDTQLSNALRESDTQKLLAHQSESALAQWILLAKSGNTNTPLTEKMESISVGLADISKTLKDRPEFELYVNESLTLNNAVIPLKKSREIYLQIRNIGSITAERLTVLFTTSLEKTNVVAGQYWHSNLFTKGQEKSGWSIISDDPIGGGNTFNVQTLKIEKDVNVPFFTVQIDTYSVGSVRQTWRLGFVPLPE